MDDTGIQERNHVEYAIDWTSETGVNIRHFQVQLEYRREGRGTTVLQEIITEYKSKGAEYFVVNIGGGEGVRKFLEENGFVIIEEEHNHITAEFELDHI